MAYGSVTSPLRKRFDRLIVAINSGKYGAAVGTRTEAFIKDFAAATSSGIKPTSIRRTRVVLGGDLHELVERGHVTRAREKSDGSGWSYAYRITPAGRRAAETIVEGISRVTLEWDGDLVLDGLPKNSS